MTQDRTDKTKMPARVGFGSVFRNVIISSLALLMCVAWAGFGVFVLFIDPAGDQANVDADTLRNAVVLIVPILLIWVAAAHYKSSRNARDDIWALHSELNSLRENSQSEAQHQHPRTSSIHDESYDESYEEPSVPELPVETAPPTDSYEPTPPLTSFSQFEDQPVAPAVPEPEYADQMSLPLNTLIRALSFPDDENDAEGFEAVYRAQDDEATAKLLDASQKILEQLAELDIFMDNLTLDIAQPEVWKFHAANADRSEIATLGAIKETEVLRSVANLLEQDAGFGETAQELVNLVNDQMLRIIETADSDQIMAFAHSRTIRAFILLGNIHLDS